MAKVEIYTSPWCGYCARAKDLLESRGVEFVEYDTMEDAANRAESLKRSGGRTSVPQIFVNGQHIGGSDDMAALDRAGKLEPLLAQPG